MTDIPQDWIVHRAALMSGRVPSQVREAYPHSEQTRELCAMIERCEQPSVDRKLLCAREALAQSDYDCSGELVFWLSGAGDHDSLLQDLVYAINIWEKSA